MGDVARHGRHWRRNFGTGGAGQDFAITTGTGGAATAGSTTGRGGNAVITLGSAGGTGTAGAPGQFEVVGGTVGAANTTPFVNVTGTWNTTGVVDAGIFENITNTASGTASKLLDLQIGGVSQHSVDKGGNMAAAGALTLGTANCTTFGTAGGLCGAEGTAPTNVSGTMALYPDSTAHEIKVATNGSASFGTLVRAQPGAVNQTSQTGSISTATLCAASAGACNVAGQYRINANFWGSGTACSVVTAGSVALTITWTDEDAQTHTAIGFPMWDETKGAMETSFYFNTALGTESAGGSWTISTNGTVIQYATTYSACTTGTGTYNLRLTAERLQ